MDFVAHGGHCCGRRHLYSMNGETAESIRNLLERHGALRGIDRYPADDNNEAEGGGLLTEVVLSDDENNPQAFAAVREAGFVETLSWYNSNSGNRCTMFVYAPAEAELTLNAAPVQRVQAPRELLQIGQRVVNRESGTTATVYRLGMHNIDVCLDGGRITEWVRRNVTAAPAVPPARVVDSTFHNVYRASGRSEAGWLTIEAARARPANVIRRDRRDVMSDGTVRWTEGV